MKFEVYRPRLAETILGWVKDFQENVLWCEQKKYPLESEVFSHWHLDPDIHPIMAYQDQVPVAYAELMIHQSIAEAEIRHLLVAPQHRMQGFGKALLIRLRQQAESLKIRHTYARILPHNALAIQCFSGAGFVRVPPEKAKELNEWESHPIHWMVFQH